MIGNDIVDFRLSERENNWRRKGFLNKIYSEEEQQFIFSSEDQNLSVWRLWSMKEAAYKAHQRQFGLSRRINPLKFHCEIESSAKGVVKNGIFGYNLFSEATSDYVYSEAFSSEFDLKKSSEILEEISPEELKNEALKHISRNAENCNFSNLRILKDVNGIPLIYSGEKAICSKLSLTHHGLYSAFLLAASV